jgi:hypothetical protein
LAGDFFEAGFLAGDFFEAGFLAAAVAVAAEGFFPAAEEGVFFLVGAGFLDSAVAVVAVEGFFFPVWDGDFLPDGAEAVFLGVFGSAMIFPPFHGVESGTDGVVWCGGGRVYYQRSRRLSFEYKYSILL